MLMNNCVDVELRNTFDNGRCEICEEKLESDCRIYGTLSGMVARPESCSLKDIYGDEPIRRSYIEGEDEDQRIALFSNHVEKTYCAACFEQMMDLIDSARSQIKENKHSW